MHPSLLLSDEARGHETGELARGGSVGVVPGDARTGVSEASAGLA